MGSPRARAAAGEGRSWGGPPAAARRHRRQKEEAELVPLPGAHPCKNPRIHPGGRASRLATSQHRAPGLTSNMWASRGTFNWGSCRASQGTWDCHPQTDLPLRLWSWEKHSKRHQAFLASSSGPRGDLAGSWALGVDNQLLPCDCTAPVLKELTFGPLPLVSPGSASRAPPPQAFAVPVPSAWSPTTRRPPSL